MDLQERLDTAMMKHCYLCRLYQSLQVAHTVVDEVLDQLEDKTGDAAMIEVSKVVDEETMKSLADKLEELSDKVHTAALDTKDEIVKTITDHKEDTSPIMPSPKKSRTS